MATPSPESDVETVSVLVASSGGINDVWDQVGGMAYQFECADPECVFLIRAADEEEVVAQVQRHSEERHGKSPPPADVIRERMDTVEVE